MQIAEWDEIKITGIATSPNGKKLVNFECTVATICKDGFIKVWPKKLKDPQLTEQEQYEGKIWFGPSTIERIELICRGDNDE